MKFMDNVMENSCSSSITPENSRNIDAAATDHSNASENFSILRSCWRFPIFSGRLWKMFLVPVSVLYAYFFHGRNAQVIHANLEDSERKLLTYIKTPYQDIFVDIGHLEVFEKPPSPNYFIRLLSNLWWGEKDIEEKQNIRIRTIIFNGNSKNIPIVMVHGLCSGVGLWGLNIDRLAQDRPVYAIDVVGFGRSTRPYFSKDATLVEKQHVEALEAWRSVVGLERFILVGHSMGGFISTAYSLVYPERVVHLVAADPWGFPKKPTNLEDSFPKIRRFISVIKVFLVLAEYFNLLAVLRALGPFGVGAIETFRPDLIRRFKQLNQNGNASVAEYIYYSNALDPTGEEAMRTLMDNVAWAKNPVFNRLHDLSENVPLTFIYGQKSWMRQIPENILREIRPNENALNIHVLKGAGHHIYADDINGFDDIIINLARASDVRN